MTEWTRHDTPRTWHFWAIWTAIRLVLGIVAYAVGWMPAFWFLLGEFVPDAMWYLRDEQLKALRRSLKLTTRMASRLRSENDSLRSTVQGYQDRYGRRAVISSITTAPRWTAVSKNSH